LIYYSLEAKYIYTIKKTRRRLNLAPISTWRPNRIFPTHFHDYVSSCANQLYINRQRN